MTGRALRVLLVAGAATLTANAGPVQGQQAVALELVLAVDASGSVSTAEFDLQVRGLSAAFRDPAVVAAVAADDGIAVALAQWSSPGHQVVAVDWTLINDATSAARFAAAIGDAGRVVEGETAIAPALRFAVAMLESNAFIGRRRAIDVSGDGASNWGLDPDAARDAAVAAGITVNGLAILNEQPDLGAYYARHVIGGPGAFVMTARDYADFAAAIRRKLIREIEGPPVARATSADASGA